ncbi:SDR family NAD(P)-dependent oxidoreductase [Microbulbifer sp. ALW1]|uniref:SDR family NAD(P)-dependent oxidoreductase n=1 Tax=Microbulbifer sp. (strain ALW1) TaxID=1516059 RepID=UPI00135AAA46|nr:SDR family NAD(P)-dependent oxidoreductase [Microbulbifer sp. ALW1]
MPNHTSPTPNSLVPNSLAPNTILLAGASGGIGSALLGELEKEYPQATILTISRRELATATGNHSHLTTSLADPKSVGKVTEWLRQKPLPNWVINCCGALHWQSDGQNYVKSHAPEKSVGQCTDDALLQSVATNVLTHLHLAQGFAPLIQRREPLTWVSLSAKVGSIEDNRLGGWYSYRMSKAALNMLVRNLAIEWARKVDHCRVVAVHPGTTDTPLSQPFQENIPAGKLYSPAQTAGRMVSVIRGLREEDHGKLLFWDGTPIPW